MEGQLIIAAFLAGIINIFLGIFIYFKDPRRATNIFFALLTFSIALWNFADFVSLIKDPSIALFWFRVFYISGILVPTFSVHLIISIIRDVIDKNWKRVLIITYMGGGILLFLIFTPFIIKDVVIEPFREVPGPLYPLFIIFFGGCFLYLICILIEAFKKSVGLKRTQISYIFLAYFIGLVAATVYFLRLQGVNLLSSLHYIIEIGYTLVVAYAIIKYRLMDVKVAVSRAGVFAIVYTLVLGIPFGIGGLVRVPLSKITPTLWWLLPMFLLVVLATAAPFIYMKLQKRIESRLRAEEFRSHEALRRLSHNMLRFTNLDNLLKLIVHYLVKILKIKFAAVYLLDSQIDKYILKCYWRPMQSLETSFEPPAEFSKDGPLVRDLYLRRLPIVTEELKLFSPKGFSRHIRDVVNSLLSLKANIVIPSFLRNSLVGFLVLSDRRTNVAFSQEDLNLLMLLSNEAALAVENAQFHQKQKMQLMERSRREALADMAPGASHQFNNRLVSISSSAELLLLKLENLDASALKDEKIKSFLNDAKTTLETIDKEVYKGKEITSAILRRAKAKVDFQKVNVPSLIKNAYRLVLISHSRSGVEKFKEPRFRLKADSKITDIFASEALLQDCFYNLIDNAFDAIRDATKERPAQYQGEVEVSLKEEDNNVIIQVKDNGIGFKEENQKRLFTPYFTTKASSNKGSGLGLYVIRDFIEMHHGSIRCESEYGKGAAFIIKLPIAETKKRGSDV